MGGVDCVSSEGRGKGKRRVLPASHPGTCKGGQPILRWKGSGRCRGMLSRCCHLLGNMSTSEPPSSTPRNRTGTRFQDNLRQRCFLKLLLIVGCVPHQYVTALPQPGAPASKHSRKGRILTAEVSSSHLKRVWVPVILAPIVLAPLVLGARRVVGDPVDDVRIAASPGCRKSYFRTPLRVANTQHKQQDATRRPNFQQSRPSRPSNPRPSLQCWSLVGRET